ncbi:MAG: J domain-containing protein [Desulfobulbus sp.]
MNAGEWQAIEQAARVLGLEDRATLAEIKRAFHRLSKLHHPDTGGGGKSGEQMYRLTEAYEILLRYCEGYRFPLRREKGAEDELDIYDPEDWWQARFGQDPLWGGKKNRRR